MKMVVRMMFIFMSCVGSELFAMDMAGALSTVVREEATWSARFDSAIKGYHAAGFTHGSFDELFTKLIHEYIEHYRELYDYDSLLERLVGEAAGAMSSFIKKTPAYQGRLDQLDREERFKYEQQLLIQSEQQLVERLGAIKRAYSQAFYQRVLKENIKAISQFRHEIECGMRDAEYQLCADFLTKQQSSLSFLDKRERVSDRIIREFSEKVQALACVICDEVEVGKTVAFLLSPCVMPITRSKTPSLGSELPEVFPMQDNRVCKEIQSAGWIEQGGIDARLTLMVNDLCNW